MVADFACFHISYKNLKVQRSKNSYHIG